MAVTWDYFVKEGEGEEAEVEERQEEKQEDDEEEQLCLMVNIMILMINYHDINDQLCFQYTNGHQLMWYLLSYVRLSFRCSLFPFVVFFFIFTLLYFGFTW